MLSSGFDPQAGGGQAAVDQVGPVLDLLQLALDDADQAVQVGGGEVGHGPLDTVRQRPFPQLELQPGPLLRAQLLPRTGPLDRSASAPPSRQARCHRRTDPGVTSRSRAISLIPSPRANRPAASSRSRSRRCCSAGVYPPRCPYRMFPSYASARPTSRPELYELILVSRPVDGDPLAVEIDILDRNGNGLFPAKAREGQNHGDIAEARLEVIERLGQAQHLRNARDENASADGIAPAGTQFQRGIRRNDPFLARPCE